MATQSQPLVSIGLPVYNGEQYLAEVLDSLLDQTYPDLEIIIADNGSTDGTEAICRAYGNRDARIQYHRSPVNRGAAWNYNRTVPLAKGKYFKWAAADDLCLPTLIEKCVAALEAHPDVVVSFTQVIDIDGDGQVMETKQSKTGFTQRSAAARFRGISRVRPTHKCEEVFGVMRTGILAKTSLIGNYTDSDRTLLAELGLYGPFYEVPEALFLHRIHENNSVHGIDRQARMAWFDPKAEGKIVFPNWRQLGELLRVISNGPISINEKLRCYGQMLYWLKRRRKRLLRDLTWAMGQIISRLRKGRYPRSNGKAGSGTTAVGNVSTNEVR